MGGVGRKHVGITRATIPTAEWSTTEKFMIPEDVRRFLDFLIDHPDHGTIYYGREVRHFLKEYLSEQAAV